MVIVGENLWKNRRIENIVLLHQQDVIFTGHQSLENLAKLVAAARAMAFVSYFEGFGIPLVEAMQAGCPVLSGNLTSLPEVAEDAALYCDPFSNESITDGLIKIDSDEDLRKHLIEKGLKRAQNFSWNKSAEIIWQAIENC